MAETQVQNFIQKEVANLLVDEEALKEWSELKDELGLEAQNCLAQDEKSPIPYLWLNTNMKAIIKELCPRSTKIENYSKTPIPVEVLRMVKTCKQEKYFDEMQIWYTDIDPDPVCVGMTMQSVYNWGSKGKKINNRIYKNSTTYKKNEVPPEDWEELKKFNSSDTGQEYYLLARWGDMARTFEELKNMAIEKFKTRTTSETKSRIRDLERELEDLESKSFQQFG
jgi:hypothetical protein